MICIQSCIRGYLQRRQLMIKPLTCEEAAVIIQKSYRGFRCRKTFHLYQQRLNIQMLCFIQQIELINNDFFTKIVRTNYCVPLKSIETINHSHGNLKQSNKILQHLFPPPPPLPLPSKFENFSPRHSDSINALSNAPPAPILPPSSVLSFTSRTSPSRHQYLSASPPSPVSKFAQVRDIFARAEAAHHSNSLKNPTISNIISSHTIPSIERSRSPKAASVLNAVQEYQRQHINNHQPIFKRFVQLSNSGPSSANRSPNIGALRSRGIGNVPPNNNKLSNKPSLSAYSTSSPQQQLKSISRVRQAHL